MDRLERERRALAAARLTGELAHAGVVLVALPWVDNSGVVRTKAVPIDRLERAAAWGVGASPVFDAFARTTRSSRAAARAGRSATCG